MARLPESFIEWNFRGRRRLIERLLNGEELSREKLFLEFTRHTPVLCTAAPGEDGRLDVNGKVVGIGYVPQPRKILEAVKAFRSHVSEADKLYFEGEWCKEKAETYAKRGLKLLLEWIYVDRDRESEIDFEKLVTIELAKRLPWSSKHTWRNLMLNRAACLVFYQPPAVSFEVRGNIEVFTDGPYHELVNLVHDAYHYTPPERRRDRPVYVLNITETYDNSAGPKGFGRKLI